MDRTYADDSAVFEDKRILNWPQVSGKPTPTQLASDIKRRNLSTDKVNGKKYKNRMIKNTLIFLS